jgi:hypothetical protein
MSSSFWRGEMAPLTDKADGNENLSGKVSKYELTINYDGAGEFHTRITFQRHDYFFRALTVPALKEQIRQRFPGVLFSYTLGRSAALANDPREILRG